MFRHSCRLQAQCILYMYNDVLLPGGRPALTPPRWIISPTFDDTELYKINGIVKRFLCSCSLRYDNEPIRFPLFCSFFASCIGNWQHMLTANRPILFSHSCIVLQPSRFAARQFLCFCLYVTKVVKVHITWSSSSPSFPYTALYESYTFLIWFCIKRFSLW